MPGRSRQPVPPRATRNSAESAAIIAAERPLLLRVNSSRRLSSVRTYRESLIGAYATIVRIEPVCVHRVPFRRTDTRSPETSDESGTRFSIRTRSKAFLEDHPAESDVPPKRSIALYRRPSRYLRNFLLFARDQCLKISHETAHYARQPENGDTLFHLSKNVHEYASPPRSFSARETRAYRFSVSAANSL